MNPVAVAMDRARLTVALLLFVLIAGFSAWLGVPKEAEPDVRIPIIYVSLSQRGISPEDAERLLLRPVETQIKSIANVKEIRSSAYDGGGFVLVEFLAGFDASRALQDVRAKVDDAKRDLPRDADEPKVTEVNLSLFPVLVVALKGPLPERTLTRFARDAKTAIEQLPNVLSAELRGARDEVLEIVVEPMLLRSYGISLGDLVTSVAAGNSLVAAGALEGGAGRFAVKVPSLIETPRDLLSFPVTASSGVAVTLGDVAAVRPTFKDATSIVRVNGERAVAIEISKRTGANLIETVDQVKAVLDGLKKGWPANLEIAITQDKSLDIRRMLGDLQNSVVTSCLLVAIVILWSLGLRATLFIGLAIPFSFLAGILALSSFGLTLNIVVLFSLILAVGMLVDDAIIVSEFAERRMSEGMPAVQAYRLAAHRMAGPVIATTATRIAAFSPLLFWPGTVGEFMKFMPLTLVATLTASLVYALLFAPTLGARFGKAGEVRESTVEATGLYMRTVRMVLRFPLGTVALAAMILVGVIATYAKLGRGVEFFPNVEPDFGLVQVRARGNLSLEEKDRIVREIERQLLPMNELQTVYVRVGTQPRGMDEVTEDTIATIQYRFVDWRIRRPASVIMEDIREATRDIPGVIVEVTKPRAGPPTGKPVQVRLTSADPALLPGAASEVSRMLRNMRDTRDVDDGLTLPGIDWSINVDRAEAAKYGAGPVSVGSAVQLVTNGLKLTEYRPNDVEKPVDVILRFPSDRRTLGELDGLLINTPSGSVPIGNFVTREAEKATGVINRVGGQRVVTVTANAAEGVQTAALQLEIERQIANLGLKPGIQWRLKGEDEERDKASVFLGKAFGTALFLIFAILLAQFNRFTSVLVTISAVFLSTIGVFIGLMVMGQAFGIVMTGIGIIANAGVIVNNNMVLIDTYDRLRRDGMDAREAILKTCAERARPVMLTAVTAMLAILPIVYGVTIDFIEKEITIGAPATQWWVHLSTAIAFGLGFATILTLLVTPAMLMALANLAAWRAARKSRDVASVPAE
jgi:multidrug efflux pump